MTDPYVNNLPKGATWSEGPALDTETLGDYDSMEIAHITSPSLKDASKNFKLPSVEQMRREVETGEFSPESIAIANSILANAESIEDAADDVPTTEDNECAVDSYIAEKPFSSYAALPLEGDDYWFEQRLSDLRHAEEQKRVRSRQWREEAEKAAPLPSAAHFKKIGTEAKKTTKVFKNLAKHLPAKLEPGANLKYRPFLILSTIRDEL